MSLRVAGAAGRHDALRAHGVVGDVREPDIIRLAPVPLYNSFDDVRRAAEALTITAT